MSVVRLNIICLIFFNNSMFTSLIHAIRGFFPYIVMTIFPLFVDTLYFCKYSATGISAYILLDLQDTLGKDAISDLFTAIHFPISTTGSFVCTCVSKNIRKATLTTSVRPIIPSSMLRFIYSPHYLHTIVQLFALQVYSQPFVHPAALHSSGFGVPQ